MAYTPSIDNLHKFGEFQSALLNDGLVVLWSELEARPIEEKGVYFRPQSVGFYAGLAVERLNAKFKENGCIVKGDIQEVFEELEDTWFRNTGGLPKLATNLLAIEMMFKDTFNRVVGLGRGIE